MADNIQIYVFSYNRPEFLDNCLSSMVKFAGDYIIKIIDDNSTDPDVYSVIDRYNSRAIIAPVPRGSSARLGGLYHNMQFALDDARACSARFAMFIQDDMQMVRKMDDSYLDHIHKFFEKYDNAVELQPCFLKHYRLNRDNRDVIEIDRDVEVYFRPHNTGGRQFSAPGIFDVDRMRALFGELRPTEKENSAVVKQKNLLIAFSAYPIMMWLPYPEYARRRSGVVARLLQKCSGAGFYPYRPMSAEELEYFLTRDIADLPIAEKFLKCQGMSRRPPWPFAEGEYPIVTRNPLPRAIRRCRKMIGDISVGGRTVRGVMRG